MTNNITASITSNRITATTSDGKNKVITATPIAINGAAGSPGASGDVASQSTLNEALALIINLTTSLTGGVQGGNWTWPS